MAKEKLTICCYGGGGKSPYRIRKNSEFRYNKTSFFNDVFLVNGFTLIELIGVIIILGVIGIIVYPVVNKSIKQSKENALKETIKNLEQAGYNYSIEYDLGYSESYNNLDIQILKEKGFIKKTSIINPVTDEEMTGCLLYRWKNKQYEFKYTEPCQVAPTIAVLNKDGVFNDRGWSTSPFYVGINSNTENYEYCVSDKECTPDTLVNNSSGEVYINQNGNYYVCVRTSNDIGSTDVVCEQYKLDTNAPALASATVYFDKGDNKLTDLLDISSASGYKVSCDKEYVKELEIGNNTVNCTVTSNNGKTLNQSIVFAPNRLKTAGYQVDTFLGSTTLKSKIETLTMLDYIEIPDNAKEVVDVSEQQNKSIMAWYTDNDNNGMYELCIGQNGGIIANPTSNFLFKDLINVTTMDIKALDTTNVTAMREMFIYMRKLKNLDLSHFDTSKVTTMSAMFNSMANLTKLDLSNFDTSKVTTMGSMFLNCNNLTKLDISHFDTSKVTNMSGMFAYMYKIETLDVSDFDTSKVTNMSLMFYQLNNLEVLTIDNFNTSQVTNMSSMFDGMYKLTSLDVSSFNTSNVTDMNYMFTNLRSLKTIDVLNFDTSNVIYMHGMFLGMSGLTKLDVSNFNTSKVTNMAKMFYGVSNVTSLDVSEFDTSQVTNMSSMFASMANLIELNVSGFDTSKVTTMEDMFNHLYNLTSLNLSSFNTSNVTDMSGMFASSFALTKLDLSSFDTSKVTDMYGMFVELHSLKELDISNFDITNVTKYGDVFLYVIGNPTITVKDDTVKIWIEARLSEVNTIGTVIVQTS